VFFWKPKLGLNEAIKRDRQPYDLWAKNGHLNLTEGRVIKLEPIAQFMAECYDRFDLQCYVYDAYRHRELQDDMLDLGIEVPMMEHPQGFRRAKDIQLWMPKSVQDLENAITEGRLRVQENPLLRWNAASAVIRQDPAGTDNKIFDKRKSRARIDGVVSMAMGVGAAAIRQKPVFPVPLEQIVEDL
jgi:phage terminase large subunit-like protein